MSLLCMRSLAYKIYHCLSVNHYPELRCVICPSVTLFALVLHLNCTALSQSESSNFFMCIIRFVICRHVSLDNLILSFNLSFNQAMKQKMTTMEK